MTKLEKDANIAVLVSPGYGAGWSSWNPNHEEFFLFDSGLIERIGMPSSLVEEYIKSQLGEDNYYSMYGWSNVVIKWIPKGTIFKISEYDGYEEIQYNNGTDWKVA